MKECFKTLLTDTLHGKFVCKISAEKITGNLILVCFTYNCIIVIKKGEQNPPYFVLFFLCSNVPFLNGQVHCAFVLMFLWSNVPFFKLKWTRSKDSEG